MITVHNGTTATKAYKDSLNVLMQEVFGFSFEPWHNRNFWNQDYESFSISDGDTMLANISAYKMKLLINGEVKEYIQLGAVATKEGYRNKGLSREIMEYIMVKYSHTPKFLFGGDSVINFYPKFGFKPVAERQPFLPCTLAPMGSLEKLHVDDPRVEDYLSHRTQFSKVFDCSNAYPVHWFHIMGMNAEHLYEIPALDVMLVAYKNGEALVLQDVVAKRPMRLEAILPYLDFEGVSRIDFGFNPDWLGLDYETKPFKIEDSTLFVTEDFGASKNHIVPFFIRT
ncbi:MAG: GNAT family N-acetyltransferase [Clostridia bacterium]|nr:GNAT family N-acetyltransferase [Clostridia bacterium]